MPALPRSRRPAACIRRVFTRPPADAGRRGAALAFRLSPESGDKGGPPSCGGPQKKAGRPGAARLARPVLAEAQKLSRAPSWMRQRDMPFSMLKPTGAEV